MADPSVRTEIDGVPPPSAGPISPTMRSIRRSNVTMPAVPPYSSMTMARGVRRLRISVSRSSALRVSGTVSASSSNGVRSAASPGAVTTASRSRIRTWPSTSSRCAP